MKATIVMLMIVCMAATQVPAMAAETPTSGDKDMCLLYLEKCASQVMTIQEKIEKLKTEIDKGTKVYTPSELERLKAKLDEAEKMLDHLLYGPGHSGGGGHR